MNIPDDVLFLAAEHKEKAIRSAALIRLHNDEHS